MTGGPEIRRATRSLITQLLDPSSRPAPSALRDRMRRHRPSVDWVGPDRSGRSACAEAEALRGGGEARTCCPARSCLESQRAGVGRPPPCRTRISSDARTVPVDSEPAMRRMSSHCSVISLMLMRWRARRSSGCHREGPAERTTRYLATGATFLNGTPRRAARRHTRAGTTPTCRRRRAKPEPRPPGASPAQAGSLFGVRLRRERPLRSRTVSRAQPSSRRRYRAVDRPCASLTSELLLSE